MDDAHLFNECAFARLSRAEEQQFQLPAGVALVLAQLFFDFGIDALGLFGLFAEAATHADLSTQQPHNPML